MNTSIQFVDSLQGIIKRGLVYGIITCVALLFVSCTENSVEPNDQQKTDALFSSQIEDPGMVLRSNHFGSASNTTNNIIQSKNGDGFTSPLFGLATAPNGDILVADAGSGIATLEGYNEVSLPGITDISTLGRGATWASVGAGADPETDSGQALYRTSQGNTRLIANLFDFEESNDPDGAGVDSNPFDVQSIGGNAALVADAGANALLKVSNQGNVEVVATFPDQLVSTSNIKSLVGCPTDNDICQLPPEIPAQSVPTSIAIGPDGYYYVGELKGFPAPTNASSIWRVSPDANGVVCGSSPKCVKAFDGGFTSIIDLAFNTSGKLFVAELDEQSWFAVEVLGGGAGGTINDCDVSTASCTEEATGIPILTAITFGTDGSLWATQNALIPGSAEVIQVP